MNRRVLDRSELDGNLGKWIQNTLESQGAIVLEPWLEKIADLSLQIEVGEKSRVLEARQFINGSRLEYRGTILGNKFRSLTPEQTRFLYSEQSLRSPLNRWHELAEALGAALYAEGYQGNAGIDAMLAKSGEKLFLRPVVEINPRWTMGRVALELEKYVLPGAAAAWLFLPAADPEVKTLATRFPVKRVRQSGRDWVGEGVLFTNDPQVAREVITALVVGPDALATIYATL